MMLRSDFVMHFCMRCLRDIDHIKLTYIDEIVLTCCFCQEDTIIKEVKDKMKRTYKVVSVDEKDRNSTRRRMVVVELQRKTEPNTLGEVGTNLDTIIVHYPAYGEKHHTRSVTEHPNNGVLNYVEAEAVSNTIREFLGLGD